MIRKTIAAVSLALFIVPLTGAAANAHQQCDAVQLAKKVLNHTAGECFYDPPPPP
jgi:hypothetical protein